MAIKTRHFINMNDRVRVRLTDHGKALLLAQHNTLQQSLIDRGAAGGYTPYEAPDEDDAGWSTWQLWTLFAYFGPYLTSMAAPNCFALDIEIGV